MQKYSGMRSTTENNWRNAVPTRSLHYTTAGRSLVQTKEVDMSSVEAAVLNLWQTACAFSADRCGPARTHFHYLARRYIRKWPSEKQRIRWLRAETQVLSQNISNSFQYLLANTFNWQCQGLVLYFLHSTFITIGYLLQRCTTTISCLLNMCVEIARNVLLTCI